MNWKILVPGLGIVGLLVAVLAAGFGKDPREIPFTLEGRPAPDFTLTDLDGTSWTLSALRGHPVVLNYWATWCSPCVEENPALQRAAKRYTADGVMFFGVLYGDEPSRAKQYLARSPSVYPTLVDPEQRSLIDYAVGGVPETFFIAKDGSIARKVVGVVTLDVLVETLESLK